MYYTLTFNQFNGNIFLCLAFASFPKKNLIFSQNLSMIISSTKKWYLFLESSQFLELRIMMAVDLQLKEDLGFIVSLKSLFKFKLMQVIKS